MSAAPSSSKASIHIVEADEQSKAEENLYIKTEEKHSEQTGSSSSSSSSSSSLSTPDLTLPFQLVPTKFSRDTSSRLRDYLKKWNLDQHSCQFRIRYLQNELDFTHPAALQAFMVELWNSPAFRSQFKELQGRELRPLPSTFEMTKLNFKQLKATATDLHFFDRLWDDEESIVHGQLEECTADLEPSNGRKKGEADDDSSSTYERAGQLKKCFEDVIDGITIGDELHKAILDPSSDGYELFSPQDRQELLFILFRHLLVGGGLNQYEDHIQPYLGALKFFYRDLCTIRTNRLTNQVEIANLVYSVTGVVGRDPTINNGTEKSRSIFGAKEKDKYHLCILSIDPNKKHVTVYYSAHTEPW